MVKYTEKFYRKDKKPSQERRVQGPFCEFSSVCENCGIERVNL